MADIEIGKYLSPNRFGWSIQSAKSYILFKKKRHGLNALFHMHLFLINLLVAIVMIIQVYFYLMNTQEISIVNLSIMLCVVPCLPFSVWFDMVFSKDVRFGMNTKKNIAFDSVISFSKIGKDIRVESRDGIWTLIGEDQLKINHIIWESDYSCEVEEVRSMLLAFWN